MYIENFNPSGLTVFFTDFYNQDSNNDSINVFKALVTSSKEKIINIIQSTNFNKMQSYEKKHGFKEAGKSLFFRKGKKNQWKNILTISQKNKILNEFKEIIETFNYL